MEWQHIGLLGEFREHYSHSTFVVYVDDGDGGFEDTAFGIDEIPSGAVWFMPLPPVPEA